MEGDFSPKVNSRPPSRRVLLLFLVMLFLLLATVAEVGARLCGARPWRPDSPGITVSPGTHFFQKDPLLGWKQLPGRYKVTLHDGFTFTATQDADGWRITRPLAVRDSPTSPSIWILGCSFTYGWSVDDEQSFPYRLQAQLPHYDVRNFGGCAYGTLQNVLEFREALKTRRKPLAAVLAYCSFHDQRNIMARSWCKNLAPWNNQGLMEIPYARLAPAGSINVRYAAIDYLPFPLMHHSAFMYLLEQSYDHLEETGLKDHEVSEQLVRQFQELCTKNGIKPVLVLLDPDVVGGQMMQYSERLRVTVGNIAPADYWTRPDYSNMPHDSHPGPLLHEVYARNLYKLLVEKVLK